MPLAFVEVRVVGGVSNGGDGHVGTGFGRPPRCARTTRPEPHPPPLAYPMDFIGNCEGRWQRNEVSKSNKGGTVFNGQQDSPPTGPIGEEHGE